ncbi:MAG TPA: acyl-CoA thioesterase [Planctomycetaceae bacterium]|nr:acyl-CoA thioesterase [Planctomycetaceae bacterium]
MDLSIHAVFEITVSVVPDDIDEMNHANNVCYIRWMQEAAVAHSTANGWGTPRYLELGSAWYARRHTVEYLAPALLGDELIVRTWIADWKGVRSTRRYRFIRPKDGVVVATAETCWAFVNLKTRRPVRIPDEVHRCFLVVGDEPESVDELTMDS